MAGAALMRSAGISRLLVRLLVVATLLTCACGIVCGQDDADQSSLGELAKKQRVEKNSKNHATARRVLNDENAPSANTEKHTSEYWATIPPAKLTVSIPVAHRPADHGVEIPLENSSVYIPFGETIWSESFDEAASEYLGMLLTRSRFRGATLKLDEVEDTSLGDQRAILVHFN